ncbi:MAG TPA: serine/threonine-protein kinase [Prosthecobacter sp.]
MNQNSPSSSLRCTRCDEPLPPGFKSGLCPVCLMDVAMRQPTQDDTLPVTAPQKPLTPEDLQPHFPQLEILECVGRGGMGVVYKARQKALGRLVALKLLAPGQTKDAAFAERFAHEARALAALNHPNIVTVHDFGESGGFYYLLMEYVDGVNLRQAMRGSHLSPEQALAIVPPICEALQYAHEHGIVHRDIKPENLLMDKSGRVKIADFGIAKMLGQQESAADDGKTASGTRSTVLGGTPQYMAPEQGSAGSRADHRVDIYSLGVVLYELLTGELPSEKLAMSAPGAMTDARLDEVVRRALQQDPGQRYQTVKELQTHLATLTAAPVEAKIHSREKYEHWFGWLLRLGGLLCICYGVLPLLNPVAESRAQVVPVWLNVSVLFFVAAWVLIVHARWLVRLSYRPLIMPPQPAVEIGGMLLRLAGLWGMGKAVTWLRDHWLLGSGGSLQLGTILLLFSTALFLFERTYAPMAYAIPGWRPLPYAVTSTRRRPSGHALASAVLLVWLLWLLPMMVGILHRRLSYDSGIEANDTMLGGMVAWGCFAAIATALGWAAVNLIRGSAGRLFGLGLATASALALPLYIGFLLLSFLIYRAAIRLAVTYTALPNGRMVEDLSQRPAMLIWATAAAGVCCLGVWLWVWKKLRALPKPAVGTSVVRPRTGAALVGGLAFAALLVLFYSFTTYRPPPSPKIAKPQGTHRPAESVRPGPQASVSYAPLPPLEPQFARHVERQLNLRLFIHGYTHTQAQGTLRLPQGRQVLSHTLPGLRDVEGNHGVQGAMHFVRTEEGLSVSGEKALAGLRFTVPERTPDAIVQEVSLSAPQAGARCLCSLREARSVQPPAGLRQRLQSSPEALAPEDYSWMRENQADLMVQVDTDGVGLRFFGGAAVPVPHSFPAGFDWMKLKDRDLARALAQAYAAIPAHDGSTLVRTQSPAVLVFATRTHFGLIENLGPVRPGDKNARLRIAHLSFNPFR